MPTDQKNNALFPVILQKAFFELKGKINRNFYFLPRNNTGVLEQKYRVIKGESRRFDHFRHAYILQKTPVVVIEGWPDRICRLPVGIFPVPVDTAGVGDHYGPVPEKVVFKMAFVFSEKPPGDFDLCFVNKYNSVDISPRKVFQVLPDNRVRSL